MHGWRLTLWCDHDTCGTASTTVYTDSPVVYIGFDLTEDMICHHRDLLANRFRVNTAALECPL